MENRKKINKTQLQAKDDDDDKDTGRQEQQQQQPAAPVKPKNDDEDDCRRSWSKRSDTLVASTELSPLWLPGAQSLELSIESSYCMYVWCPCKTQACQNQNESIVREGGRQRVVAL